MSHHGHIPGGRGLHVNPPPNLHLPKAPEYKSPQDTGEAARAGALIGKLIRWLVVGTIWPATMGIATVLDLLRMKSAPEGYVSGRRILLVWVGFFSYAIWASGTIGGLFLGAVWAFTCLTPIVNILISSTMIFGSPLFLNSLMSPFVPFVATRLRLMTAVFSFAGSSETGNRAAVLNGLATPVFAGYSLLDLHFYVDCASLLIPLYLTILATVKFSKLRKAGSGGIGSQMSASPWTGTQKMLLALGLIVLFLGLPGAPAGQWVLFGLVGWMLRGVTKDTSQGGFEGVEASSGHHDYTPQYDSYEPPTHTSEAYPSAPLAPPAAETHTSQTSTPTPSTNTNPERQGSGPFGVEVIDGKML